MDGRGGLARTSARRRQRPTKVDAHLPALELPSRQAVPRKVAQPPQPSHQEDQLEQGGGVDPIPDAPHCKQQVGRDR